MAVANLDAERARKFLNLLAEEPFVCLVMVGDDLRLFAKDIDDDHLARIKASLTDIEGAPDGEG